MENLRWFTMENNETALCAESRGSIIVEFFHIEKLVMRLNSNVEVLRVFVRGLG